MQKEFTFEKTSSIEDIKDLIIKYSSDHYSSNRKISREKSFALRCKEIQSFIDKNLETSLVIKQGNTVKGFTGFQILEWDSKHFGFTIAILNYFIAEDNVNVKTALLLYFDSWCKEKGVRLAYARIPYSELSSTHLLEANDYKFMETRVHNFVDLHNYKPAESSQGSNVDIFFVEYSQLSEEDLEKALILASNGFFLSRFHQDILTKERADDLFVAWVRSSFQDPTKKKLALRINGEFAGFFIYYLKNIEELGLTSLRFDLSLVSPKYRGTGVGYIFTEHILNSERSNADFGEWSYVLNNLQSFNISAKLHSNFVFSELTFHKHFR